MSVCVRVHVPALRKVNIRMCGSIWGAWGLTLSRTVKTKRNVCLFVCFVCLNTHMFLYLSVTWTRTRSAVHVPYFWVTSALNRLKTWNPSCVSFHVRSPGWMMMMMMMMSRFALERRHGARSSSTLAGIHISPSASETRSCRLFTSRSGDFSSSCPPTCVVVSSLHQEAEAAIFWPMCRTCSGRWVRLYVTADEEVIWWGVKRIIRRITRERVFT